jgi:transcriptional regulator with XRE-family HTH domain
MPSSLHSARYKRLCGLLIEARVAKKLTQAELAKRLGKPQSFVAKYEGRERRLDVIEFLEIAAAIGVAPIKVIRNL